MRLGNGLAMLCALAALSVVLAQDESKSTTKPIPSVLDPALVWNFQFEGKKKRGQFIELLQANESRGRTLMITHLELRTRASTRVAIVEHRKFARRKRNGGGTIFRKTVRRSELFSLGMLESTTQYVASGFSTLIGMKFDPGTRPALEVTSGGGQMAVYAEGYWSRSRR